MLVPYAIHMRLSAMLTQLWNDIKKNMYIASIFAFKLPFLMETSLEMHQFYWFLRTQIPGRLSRCNQNTVLQLGLYTPENSPGKYIKSVTKKSKACIIRLIIKTKRFTTIIFLDGDKWHRCTLSDPTYTRSHCGKREKEQYRVSDDVRIERCK